MKTRMMIVGLAVILLAAGCATPAQRAEKRARTAAQVSEVLASRHLRVNVRSMNALRYGSRQVTPDFYLELHNDTLDSYLPYFGQVQQVNYGLSTKGLNFKVPVQRIVESHPKAGMTCFEMWADSGEDHYLYRIEIFDNGQAYIYISAQGRDNIGFDGELELL